MAAKKPAHALSIEKPTRGRAKKKAVPEKEKQEEPVQEELVIDTVKNDISEIYEDDREPAESETEERAKKPDRYFEAVGRRKTAIARVRIFTRSGDFLVNDKPYTSYFLTKELQKIAEDALQKMKVFGRFRISAKISGGGIHGQAEAVRHGLARCLMKFNPDFRKRLKRAGFLRRDPRMKERKKFGLKKARKAPQWHKR